MLRHTRICATAKKTASCLLDPEAILCLDKCPAFVTRAAKIDAMSICEPWSILTIWLMVIPSIIRILIVVIINPYEPLDD
jgi:hypothetical protein